MSSCDLPVISAILCESRLSNMGLMNRRTGSAQITLNKLIQVFIRFGMLGNEGQVPGMIGQMEKRTNSCRV